MMHSGTINGVVPFNRPRNRNRSRKSFQMLNSSLSDQDIELIDLSQQKLLPNVTGERHESPYTGKDQNSIILEPELPKYHTLCQLFTPNPPARTLSNNKNIVYEPKSRRLSTTSAFDGDRGSERGKTYSASSYSDDIPLLDQTGVKPNQIKRKRATNTWKKAFTNNLAAGMAYTLSSTKRWLSSSMPQSYSDTHPHYSAISLASMQESHSFRFPTIGSDRYSRFRGESEGESSRAGAERKV